MSLSNQKPKVQRLIKGCIKGDYRSQRLLYQMFSPKMFGICLRYAKDYHQAEDILQEGFIKVYKNVHNFRGDGSFEGWIRRIFVNTAIEAYRKSVSMYPIVEIENINVPQYSENILSQLAAEDLMKLVMKLAAGYRTVFNLYVIEGYSHKEISALLGISEGTSKSQLARARYMLQKMINQQSQSENQTSENLGEIYG